MEDKATFIISLDTEMLWGFVVNPANKHLPIVKEKGDHYREIIDFLLNLFERYRIPATWAFVGHLFLDHCKKEDGIPHKNMPRFRGDWYDLDPCTNIYKDPLWYGRDILDKVLSSPVEHEIGYHSFSHVPFTECSREVAQAEVDEGIRLAEEFGIELKSFVFPQNRVAHVDILKQNGFRIFRGRNSVHGNINQRFITRYFNGALDKTVALSVEPKWRNGIWEISSSMFFCDPRYHFTLLPRAKIGLEMAIRQKKVFHIFLHPHNLLVYDALKKDLEKFLAYASKRRAQGKLDITTMGEFAARLNGEKHEE